VVGTIPIGVETPPIDGVVLGVHALEARPYRFVVQFEAVRMRPLRGGRKAPSGSPAASIPARLMSYDSCLPDCPSVRSLPSLSHS
jgi:hypothetical protein